MPKIEASEHWTRYNISTNVYDLMTGWVRVTSSEDISELNEVCRALRCIDRPFKEDTDELK